MAKSVNGVLLKPLPDFSNDISDSSTDDSYELYKKTQRIPSIPMPNFKKLPQGRKIFIQKSPSELRIRRSAIMNVFGGHKQMIASTPLNPTSAATASSENSLLQLSSIERTSNNVDDKPVNNNKLNIRRSKSNDDLSKKYRKKNVSASVKAVADHLKSLSETLRKESAQQSINGGRKNQIEKNSSNIEDAVSVANEHKSQLTEKRSKNLLRQSLNKELYKNIENELAGIEVLNFSSEDDVANRAKTAVELCRYSHFPARRTVLMERQTQTTDSLEKLFKNVASPLKEAEEIEKEHSAKRKIIEPEEASSRGGKKSKTILNQLAGEEKDNNKKKQINKHAQAQTSTSSVASERYEPEQQGQEFQRSMQNELLPLDADIRSTSTTVFNNARLQNSVEDDLIENFLKSIDSKMNGASIVSISSTSEITLEKSLNNYKQTLINTVSSEDTGISTDNLVNAEDNIPDEIGSINNLEESAHTPKRKDQPSNKEKVRGDSQIINKVTSVNTSTFKNAKNRSINDPKELNKTSGNSKCNNIQHKSSKSVQNDNHEHNIRNSRLVNTVNASADAKNKSLENSKSNAFHGNTTRSRKVDGAVNATTSNTTSETLQSTSGAAVALRNKSSKKTKPNSKQEPVRESKKLPVEVTTLSNKSNDNCEPAKASEVVDKVDVPKKKAGRRKGTKNKNKWSTGLLSTGSVISDSHSSTRSTGRQRTSVVQQSIQISKTTNKTGRPGRSKNKSVVLEPYFVDMLSGFVQVPDNRVQNNNEDNDRGENKSKRQRQPPAKYIQSIFVDANVMKKSRGRKPKKSMIETSKKQLKYSSEQNPSKANVITSNVATVSDYDSGESMRKNSDGPSTSKSVNKSNVKTLSVNVERLESVKHKLINSSKKPTKMSNTITENNSTQKNDDQITEKTTDLESMHSAVISPTSKDTAFTEMSTQLVTNRYDLRNNNSVIIDSGVGGSLPTDVIVPEATAYPSIVVHENISIQPSFRAGSQASKALSGCRKERVTFSEPPVQIPTSKQHTFSLTGKYHGSPEQTDSQRCIVDNTHTNDDSFSATPAEVQTGSRSNVLYTIIDNEVTGLDWYSQAPEFGIDPPTSGMAVKFSLRNVKSLCGISSYGHVVLAPNYQKPWQISKKYNITYKVERGEAVVKVQSKEKIAGVGCMFYIPLGAEYTIKNLTAETLILFFHKISPH